MINLFNDRRKSLTNILPQVNAKIGKMEDTWIKTQIQKFTHPNGGEWMICHFSIS